MDSNSFRLPVFPDDDAVVIACARKRLVYLDSNIWIDIAERQQDVAELCRRAVCTGQATFPVSYWAVAEVIEQPNLTQRSHIAALMDELSEGISFRDRDDIWAMEAEAVLEVLLGRTGTPIGREKVLCPIVERLGRIEIEFPPGWNQSDAQEFIELVARRPELRSVRWLVDHLDIEKMQANHAQSKRKYVDKMSEAISRSAAYFGNVSKQLRRKRLLLEERVGLFKRVIIPCQSRELLRAFGPNMDALNVFFKQVGEGSEERLEQGMRAMPSQDLFCHIMAEQTSNYARKVKEQDFHDVEHAIVPAVYGDLFVTGDCYLLDLLTRRCDIPAARGCQIVRGVQGLREVLKSLAGEDM